MRGKSLQAVACPVDSFRNGTKAPRVLSLFPIHLLKGCLRVAACQCLELLEIGETGLTYLRCSHNVAAIGAIARAGCQA